MGGGSDCGVITEFCIGGGGGGGGGTGGSIKSWLVHTFPGSE